MDLFLDKMERTALRPCSSPIRLTSTKSGQSQGCLQTTPDTLFPSDHIHYHFTNTSHQVLLQSMYTKINKNQRMLARMKSYHAKYN